MSNPPPDQLKSQHQQAAFELSHKVTYKREDFFVAPCNQLALSYIDLWPNWSSPFLILKGEKGAGKTHLLHLWAQKAGADICGAAQLDEQMMKQSSRHLAIDDLDGVIGHREKEEIIFHLYNQMASQKKFIFATMTQKMSDCHFLLKDLESRLRKENSISIDLPDESLLASLMVKLYRDRQIIVTDDVIFYALARLPRSFEAIHHCVIEVDRLAFERSKAITKNLIKEVINSMASFC